MGVGKPKQTAKTIRGSSILLLLKFKEVYCVDLESIIESLVGYVYINNTNKYTSISETD